MLSKNGLFIIYQLIYVIHQSDSYPFLSIASTVYAVFKYLVFVLVLMSWLFIFPFFPFELKAAVTWQKKSLWS